MELVGVMVNKVLALILFLGMGCGSTFDGATHGDVMRAKAQFAEEIARLERQNEYFEHRLQEYRASNARMVREGLACSWAMSYTYGEFGEDHARMCAEEDEYSCELLQYAYLCGLGGANTFDQIRRESEE